MGSPASDLDRFLRTDGLRILKASGAFRAGRPLAEEAADGFAAMSLEGLDESRLEDLLDRAEGLLDRLEDGEPDAGSPARGLWKSRLSGTEAFVRRLLARLDELAG